MHAPSRAWLVTALGIYAITALLLLGWMGSMWFNLGWMGRSGAYVGVASGRAVIGVDASVPGDNPDAGWSFRSHPAHASWWFESGRFPGSWSLSVPLWLPALACGAASAVLWRRRVRAQRPERRGACPACEYPVAELPPYTRCPECGAAREGPLR